jgi:aconitate hydratase
MNHTIDSTPTFVAAAYERMARTLAVVRRRLGRPLTLAEKILLSHLDDPEGQELQAGSSYLALRPDRVAMQDATAQMALLQFAHAGRARVAVPTTVHCDHLIEARAGADADIAAARVANDEVYEFLGTASQKYGIGFWKPGAGIIHQVVLEHYAFPGGLMIGTDSHTPNAGGLGMIACGVGGADAVDVMAGFPWEVLYPTLIGVHLTGTLRGWTAPKDVILKLCGILTTKGGTNRILEFFGPGVEAISCTGKATITNMGAELGATSSVFPFDPRMDRYLSSTGRAALAELAGRHSDLLAADPEVAREPARYFEQIVEIDLAELEPHVVGPHTPDLARPVSAMAAAVREHDYHDGLSAALIGSCTNSSYEDVSRAADVARQARAHGRRLAVPLLVSPGSEQIRATIARDGQLALLEEVGATVLANACGPCIGQWKRTDLAEGERTSIITSFNRNFPRRNDGNPGTLAFIASPEIVMAYGLAGRLSFNPLGDTLEDAEGRPFTLAPPAPAPELPASGFVADTAGYVSPTENGAAVEIRVAPGSERLQLLAPFPSWNGRDFRELPILLKAKGKCTTDHISAAGPWLRFRGHLDRISDNAFLGAVNAYSGEAGKGLNQLTGERGETFSQVARAYKAAGLRWVVVADENYGEGSSREHAAMSPRFLGAAAIVARSFARIHESNLKKQGVLPLTFAELADYERVRETDRVSLLDLAALAPGAPIAAVLHHADGTTDPLTLRHSLNAEQIAWFKAGSALNLLRSQAERRGSDGVARPRGQAGHVNESPGWDARESSAATAVSAGRESSAGERGGGETPGRTGKNAKRRPGNFGTRGGGESAPPVVIRRRLSKNAGTHATEPGAPPSRTVEPAGAPRRAFAATPRAGAPAFSATGPAGRPGEEDFAALFAASEASRPEERRVAAGDVVRGRVVALGPEMAFVTIGAKAEAVMDVDEFRDPATGELRLAVGDQIEATVTDDGSRSGSIVLKRTLGRGGHVPGELEQALHHGIAVEGVVTGQNKGGFDVQVAGARAFCPASQIDLRRADPAGYVGQRLRFRVTKIAAGGRNVVVSRRLLLEEEAATQAARTWEQLQVGAVVRGTVTSIRDFGVFVDLGGIEGMIHVSEIGHGRPAHPSELLQVGQSVEAQVVKLEPAAAGSRGRIGLSLRALTPDPWTTAAERFPVGTELRGTVRRLEPFGAFVEITPGVDGLVHVSRMALDRRVSHPKQVVNVGQEVDVTVLAVEPEKRRIGLSMVEHARREREATMATERREERATLAKSSESKSLGTFADLLAASAKKPPKH